MDLGIFWSGSPRPVIFDEGAAPALTLPVMQQRHELRLETERDRGGSGPRHDEEKAAGIGC